MNQANRRDDGRRRSTPPRSVRVEREVRARATHDTYVIGRSFSIGSRSTNWAMMDSRSRNYSRLAHRSGAPSGNGIQHKVAVLYRPPRSWTVYVVHWWRPLTRPANVLQRATEVCAMFWEGSHC